MENVKGMEKEEVLLKKTKKINIKTILKLFYSSFYISLIAFGGGFVVLSLLRETFVKKLAWVTDEEMMDINALSQASPGAIAMNTAMLVGFKVAGLIGMIATVIGSVIPPLLVITGLYYFYDAIKGFTVVTYIMKGMQAGVCGVILSLVIDMWKNTIKEKSVFAVTLLTLSFLTTTALQFFFNISVVIYVVLLSAVLGVGFSYLLYFAELKKQKKEEK